MHDDIADPVLRADGELARLIAALDWSRTAIGPIDQWPRNLKATVALMLRSPVPMVSLWGEPGVMIYNDAYAVFAGRRHPQLLGSNVREGWPEVADFNDNVMKVGLAGGTLTYVGHELTLHRNGIPEQVWMDLDYSPVVDDEGKPIGVIAIVVETTAVHRTRQALEESERRLRFLDGLNNATATLGSADDVLSVTARMTAKHLGVSHCAYADMDEDGDGFTIRGDWHAPGSPSIVGHYSLADFGTLAVQELNAGRPLIVNDNARELPPAEAKTFQDIGIAATICMPLIKDGRLIALMAIHDRAPHIWSDYELSIIREVTERSWVHVERVRSQETLRASEARLRRAQEAGGIGIFSVDIDQDLIHGTPEFCRIFGLDQCENLPAAEVQKLVLPEDATLISDTDRRREGTAALDVEYRIRRADTGEIRTIARKGEYEHDENGRPVRMVGVVLDITERRAVQRALEESEAQFRTFAQSMPNQVWTAPPDGKLDWFNERVFAYSGRTEEELRGTGWANIVHPEDVGLAQDRWASALASGETYEAEFRLRRHDGEYRWHLSRAIPIRSGGGAIMRWIGTNTDIHEQKQAEVENARDRDRMWSMSQDLLLVCDRDGVITDVNPSATRMLGWEAAEMIGHPILEFIHPADRESSRAEMERLGSGATTIAFENRYRTKSGDYRLLDWTAVPDGDRIHGIGRDITENRSIARDQERIWTLSPVLKLVAQPNGTIEKINPAWTDALGWTQEQTSGRPLIDFVAETDSMAAGAALERLMLGGVRTDEEYAFRTSEGGVRQIAWNFVAEGGALYGFGRDVTEQRGAEEALRQSQKMEAVGQLTGGIAHDFNNLLQGVTGNLELLQHRLEQGRLDGLERFIKGAANSASRASALTHRLLAFSRRQPLDPRAVRTNPLVASMEDMLRRTLGENIELELVLAGGLWLTKCDPNQLESAILNLAINARDAMPQGGKLIVETCNAHLDSAYAARQREVRPGQYVCICVSDTGVGMDADTAARAFEPFFTTKPLGQGTGLGLSMIYGFARQSEGYVKIYSEVGKGTTIKLYLPRHRGEAADEEEVPQLSGEHVSETGETVLVVEDEPIVRGLIVEVLSELGYRAIEAVDGPSGLQVLQSRRRIDLLVTDIGLPGLNGRQVADGGRAHRPDLKVLFMTGYAENAALASGFLEPGMEMITKPFAMEALATRIRDMIQSG